MSEAFDIPKASLAARLIEQFTEEGNAEAAQVIDLATRIERQVIGHSDKIVFSAIAVLISMQAASTGKNIEKQLIALTGMIRSAYKDFSAV